MLPRTTQGRWAHGRSTSNTARTHSATGGVPPDSNANYPVADGDTLTSSRAYGSLGTDSDTTARACDLLDQRSRTSGTRGNVAGHHSRPRGPVLTL